jgi:hypothetical protein
MKRLLAMAFILIVFACSNNRPQIIASGTFDHAEYGQGGWATPSRTFYYFEDGRSFVCNGIRNIEFVKGETLFVYENWDGSFNILRKAK